jgi:hypothetical protein
MNGTLESSAQSIGTLEAGQREKVQLTRSEAFQLVETILLLPVAEGNHYDYTGLHLYGCIPSYLKYTSLEGSRHLSPVLCCCCDISDARAIFGVFGFRAAVQKSPTS